MKNSIAWMHLSYFAVQSNIANGCHLNISQERQTAPYAKEEFMVLFQYPIRCLIVRSREVSKPFKLSHRFESWQAHWQHCCRGACYIWERSYNSKYKFRGFKTLRDPTIRRLFGYWNGAQAVFIMTKQGFFFVGTLSFFLIPMVLVSYTIYTIDMARRTKYRFSIVSFRGCVPYIFWYLFPMQSCIHKGE